GAQTTAPLVGPALAGVLIAALGASNVLYVDAATFGVAAIAVGLFVPRTKPMAEGEERGLLAGVRYILRSRLLVMLCVSTLTMEVFFTLFLTTLPVFAYSYYDQNARIACLLRRDGCRSAARDARRPGGRAPVRGAPGRRSRIRARVD